MCSDHLGEIVEHMERMVCPPCAYRGNPDLERVEDHVRHTFELGLDGTDAARGAPWRHEAQVTEAKVRADTTSPCGQHQRIPNVAETKFIDRERAEVPGVTQIDHLCATRGYCAVGKIRGRNVSSTIGKWRVQQVIVGKVVAKERSETSVLVNADAALIVSEFLCVRGGDEQVVR